MEVWNNVCFFLGVSANTYICRMLACSSTELFRLLVLNIVALLMDCDMEPFPSKPSHDRMT